jgi:hypothetical protein
MRLTVAENRADCRLYMTQGELDSLREADRQGKPLPMPEEVLVHLREHRHLQWDRPVLFQNPHSFPLWSLRIELEELVPASQDGHRP